MHANDFEWCINAPPVDLRGTVYVNSEDGNLYAIAQGGTLLGHIPEAGDRRRVHALSLGPEGTIYTEIDGILFAVGK